MKHRISKIGVHKTPVEARNHSFRVSSNTIRRANRLLIKNGISDKARNLYNGDIRVNVHFRNGVKTRVFTNADIKNAFKEAMNVYAERV